MLKTNKLASIFYRTILRHLPLILFPKLNVILFNKLGYNLHPTVRIYSSVQIMGDINVEIGSYTFIGHETLLTGGLASIKIGKYCDISDRVNIFCGSHKISKNSKRIAGKGIGKSITIGNGVWIGLGASILPGITIGSKSIIAAGTIVTKDVPSNVIVGGNPMRIIREI